MSLLVRVSKIMLELLGGDPEFFEPSGISIPIELEQLATAGFAEVAGCVVPTSAPAGDFERVRRTFPNDETGAEVFVSHVHVEQYLPERTALHELARLGFDYAFLLQRELLRSSIPGPFRVIVAVSATDSGPNYTGTCTVRYHRRREGQVWLDDDLERYGEEGIAVIDTDVTTSP